MHHRAMLPPQGISPADCARGVVGPAGVTRLAPATATTKRRRAALLLARDHTVVAGQDGGLKIKVETTAAARTAKPQKLGEINPREKPTPENIRASLRLAPTRRA